MKNDDTPQSVESTDNYRAKTGDRDETPATKSQSTWTDNGPSQSRRKLLKQVGGLGATSIVGFSGLAAAQEDSTTELNTDFTPKDKKQVKRFIERLRTKSEKKRTKLWDQLSKPQQQAIVKGLMPARQTIERMDTQPQPSDGTIQAQDLRASAQYEVESYSYLGTLLWKFQHKVIWNYVPPSPNYPGDVYNITSYVDPTLDDPFWKYNGIASQYTRDEGASFTAYREGEFALCVTPDTFCNPQSYPFITVTGFSGGGAVLDDSSCDC